MTEYRSISDKAMKEAAWDIVRTVLDGIDVSRDKAWLAQQVVEILSSTWAAGNPLPEEK